MFFILVYPRKHSRTGSKNTTYYMGARLILELENWLEKNIEVKKSIFRDLSMKYAKILLNTIYQLQDIKTTEGQLSD